MCFTKRIRPTHLIAVVDFSVACRATDLEFTQVSWGLQIRLKEVPLLFGETGSPLFVRCNLTLDELFRPVASHTGARQPARRRQTEHYHRSCPHMARFIIPPKPKLRHHDIQQALGLGGGPRDPTLAGLVRSRCLELDCRLERPETEAIAGRRRRYTPCTSRRLCPCCRRTPP